MYVCVCASVGTCACMCMQVPYEVQERVSDSLKQKLQVFVSHLMWVLGTGIWSSGRAEPVITTESVPSLADLIFTNRMWTVIEKLHRTERQPEEGEGLHGLDLSLGSSFWCALTQNPAGTEFRDFTESRSHGSRGFCSSSVRCWESHCNFSRLQFPQRHNYFPISSSAIGIRKFRFWGQTVLVSSPVPFRGTQCSMGDRHRHTNKGLHQDCHRNGALASCSSPHRVQTRIQSPDSTSNRL